MIGETVPAGGIQQRITRTNGVKPLQGFYRPMRDQKPISNRTETTETVINVIAIPATRNTGVSLA